MGRTTAARIRRVGVLGIVALVAGAGIPAATTAVAAAAPRAQVTLPASACTSTSYTLTLSATTTSGTTSLPVTGQIDFAGGAATAAITLPSNLPWASLAGSTISVVLVGGKLYLAVPASLQGFVGGAPWVSLALPSSVTSALASLDATVAGWCGNAQSFVSWLESQGITTTLGTSTVAGSSAIGTQVKMKARKLSRLSKVMRQADKKFPRVAGSAPVTVQVWQNSQGQLVELSVALSGLRGQLTAVGLDLTLSGIDAPVSIS
ncbi:MAG TPA: hypothetical protein VKR22_14345, partial [Acidimicrobiales bacterium]|nr:hypothetical protein [Acidimicrobiales bacterium]